MKTLVRTFLLLSVFLPAAIAVQAQPAPGAIQTISAETLHERLKGDGEKPMVVDVREPSEFEAGHIDGALLAPLAHVEDHLNEVPKGREIVLVCHSGRRSALAYARLAERGFTALRNMEG